MLKVEHRYLQYSRARERELKSKKITEEEYRILDGFFRHIDYITSEPSQLDKKILARAYYEGT